MVFRNLKDPDRHGMFSAKRFARQDVSGHMVCADEHVVSNSLARCGVFPCTLPCGKLLERVREFLVAPKFREFRDNISRLGTISGPKGRKSTQGCDDHARGDASPAVLFDSE